MVDTNGFARQFARKKPAAAKTVEDFIALDDKYARLYKAMQDNGEGGLFLDVANRDLKDHYTIQNPVHGNRTYDRDYAIIDAEKVYFSLNRKPYEWNTGTPFRKRGRDDISKMPNSMAGFHNYITDILSGGTKDNIYYGAHGKWSDEELKANLARQGDSRWALEVGLALFGTGPIDLAELAVASVRTAARLGIAATKLATLKASSIATLAQSIKDTASAVNVGVGAARDVATGIGYDTSAEVAAITTNAERVATDAKAAEEARAAAASTGRIESSASKSALTIPEIADEVITTEEEIANWTIQRGIERGWPVGMIDANRLDKLQYYQRIRNSVQIVKDDAKQLALSGAAHLNGYSTKLGMYDGVGDLISQNKSSQSGSTNIDDYVSGGGNGTTGKQTDASPVQPEIPPPSKPGQFDHQSDHNSNNRTDHNQRTGVWQYTF
jgi:hypothetical protein